MVVVTAAHLDQVQLLDNGVIVLGEDEETVLAVPIDVSAGRPILLSARNVADLLERSRWDADAAAAVLSSTIDAQRRAGDASWDRRRR